MGRRAAPSPATRPRGSSSGLQILHLPCYLEVSIPSLPIPVLGALCLAGRRAAGSKKEHCPPPLAPHQLPPCPAEGGMPLNFTGIWEEAEEGSAFPAQSSASSSLSLPCSFLIAGPAESQGFPWLPITAAVASLLPFTPTPPSAHLIPLL